MRQGGTPYTVTTCDTIAELEEAVGLNVNDIVFVIQDNNEVGSR